MVVIISRHDKSRKVLVERREGQLLAALCLSRTATVGPGRTSELVSGPPHCPSNV